MLVWEGRESRFFPLDAKDLHIVGQYLKKLQDSIYNSTEYFFRNKHNCN